MYSLINFFFKLINCILLLEFANIFSKLFIFGPFIISLFVLFRNSRQLKLEPLRLFNCLELQLLIFLIPQLHDVFDSLVSNDLVLFNNLESLKLKTAKLKHIIEQHGYQGGAHN